MMACSTFYSTWKDGSVAWYELVYRDLLGGAEDDHETTHDIWSLLRYLNPEPPKFSFGRNISASNYSDTSANEDNSFRNHIR